MWPISRCTDKQTNPQVSILFQHAHRLKLWILSLVIGCMLGFQINIVLQVLPFPNFPAS